MAATVAAGAADAAAAFRTRGIDAWSIWDPFFAVADPTAQDYVLRRSRAGDAWDRAQAESCGAPAPGMAGGSGATSLGMPTLRPRS